MEITRSLQDKDVEVAEPDDTQLLEGGVQVLQEERKVLTRVVRFDVSRV